MNAPTTDLLKLHLGCGGVRLAGWVNIDAEGPSADLHHDLRRPLPQADRSVSHIFSEHFIEHVGRPEALALLQECRRVLVPGGVLRLSTPDLRYMVGMYIAGKVQEWADMHWLPESPCALLNEGMRLWGHQWLYDREDLGRLLGSAGFKRADFRPYRQSSHPELLGLETRPYHHELIVEAIA